MVLFLKNNNYQSFFINYQLKIDYFNRILQKYIYLIFQLLNLIIYQNFQTP